jgi:syntaxin 1B/2/3
METFFADVQRVKTHMGEIRAALVALFDAHEASKRSTTAEETRETRSSMTETIERVSKIARETKLRLENLDADNERAVKSGAVTEGSSEHRTRSTLTSSLKKKLKDQMGEFQELRERLREEYKEIVERRYFTVTGSEAREEDIERLIETGESETMFQNALLERGRGQIMDTVNEIQERHSAIRELERKLLELNQIFLDMSVLVEAQGEMIDNVASHVAKSVVYVQQGHVELRRAREHQKSTRKWACCISVILLIVLIAILLPVLKPWKSGSA